MIYISECFSLEEYSGVARPLHKILALHQSFFWKAR